MAYFLLSRGGAGTGACAEFTKEQFLEWTRRKFQKGDNLIFATKIPTSMMEWWGDEYILIKGEIVEPAPKRIITEWEVD